MTDDRLRSLFSPASVGVVGASTTPGSFGGLVLANLRAAGYEGRIHGVNPRYDDIDGIPSYPNIASMPGPVDCVVIVVPGAAAVTAVEEAAAAGVGSAVVLSSGFKEMDDPESAERQEVLARIAAEGGPAILGPNCLGLANFGEKAVLTFVPGFPELARRVRSEVGVAVVSQSGALGSYVLHAQARDVPFSYFVSTGNSAALDVGDCVQYLAGAPGVASILLTFEGLRPGTALLGALEHAATLGTPVVAIKAGQSEAGASAVVSHTGAAVGDHQACRAALEARGALMVNSLGDGLEAAAFLGKLGRTAPTGRGVGVVTGSGGAGVLAADAAARQAVKMATLSAGTQHSLRNQMPAYGAAGNPVDVTASAAKGDLIGRVLETVAADPDVGAIMVPMGFALYDDSAEERRKVVLEAATAVDVPVAVVWMSEWFENEAAAPFERADGVGLFRNMDSCFRALGQWLHPPRSLPEARAGIDLGTLDLGSGSATLDEARSRQLLERVGVPFVETIEVAGTELAGLRQALTSWKAYPAALKILSADLPHKSKVGGVAIGLGNEAAVLEAAERIIRDVSAGAPGARLDGFLLQEMSSGTQEILVGAVRDPVYGPVVAVGPGGTGAGARQSVGVLPVPLTAELALAKLRDVPGVSHLPPQVLSELANVAAGVGELMAGVPAITEIDINPLIVTGGGTRVVAVDALVRLDDAAVTR